MLELKTLLSQLHWTWSVTWTKPSWNINIEFFINFQTNIFTEKNHKCCQNKPRNTFCDHIGDWSDLLFLKSVFNEETNPIKWVDTKHYFGFRNSMLFFKMGKITPWTPEWNSTTKVKTAMGNSISYNQSHSHLSHPATHKGSAALWKRVVCPPIHIACQVWIYLEETMLEKHVILTVAEKSKSSLKFMSRNCCLRLSPSVAKVSSANL